MEPDGIRGYVYNDVSGMHEDAKFVSFSGLKPTAVFQNTNLKILELFSGDRILIWFTTKRMEQ